MVNHLFRLTLRLFACMALLYTIQIQQAFAQTGTSATLLPPDITRFPSVSTYLDARDADGNFLHGLDSTQVAIVEDGRRLPVKALNDLEAGAQFAVALNPGLPFALRSAEGVSRYDLLVKALKSWMSSRQGSSGDDLSLVISEGLEVIHVTNTAELASALDNYKGDLRAAQPSLDSLSLAIETVADPTPRPGMGRVVLFVTPLLGNDLIPGLQSLAGRASQQGIHIFVWLIGSPDQFNGVGAAALQDIANKTHAQMTGFSGTEQIPNLEDYLKPLRSVYSLDYESRVKSSGPHQVVAEIDTGSLKVSSTPISYDIDLRPPNPMLVSPPTEINRDVPKNNEQQPASLAPSEQPLQMLVEFPDGYPRSLITTTLFVDDVPVLKNIQAPYDHFNWDLRSYTTSGEHRLKVEAVDILGLQGASADVPIQINIKNIPPTVTFNLTKRVPVVAGVAVILAGAVLALVLILGGRIRPRTFGQGSSSKNAGNSENKARENKNDPLTQPVSIPAEPARHLPTWMNRLHLPQKRVNPKAFAYLTRLSESDEDTYATPIPINVDEITMGRNPARSLLLVDDASVEPLHARLVREGSSFRLSDEGTVAGTWVNYMPVAAAGVLLEHGDLIHIGRAGFRFTLRQPIKVRKPVVIPKEPES